MFAGSVIFVYIFYGSVIKFVIFLAIVAILASAHTWVLWYNCHDGFYLIKGEGLLCLLLLFKREGASENS